jgi:CheY-like chemotaxis protein
MSTLPKILIVDDDHDTLDLLEMYLYKNYEVVTALNGFEALAKIEEELPSLIMTDIKMPVMDGLGFFNSLRKQPSTKHIPVIAITSFVKEHSVKSLINMGFNAVVAKPPDCKAVTEAAAKILKPETPERQPS